MSEPPYKLTAKPPDETDPVIVLFTFVRCHFHVQIPFGSLRGVHFKRNRRVGPAIFRIDTRPGHAYVFHGDGTFHNHLRPHVYFFIIYNGQMSV